MLAQEAKRFVLVVRDGHDVRVADDDPRGVAVLEIGAMFGKDWQLDIGTNEHDVGSLFAKQNVHAIEVARVVRHRHEPAPIGPVEPGRQRARVDRDDGHVQARLEQRSNDSLTEQRAPARDQHPGGHRPTTHLPHAPATATTSSAYRSATVWMSNRDRASSAMSCRARRSRWRRASVIRNFGPDPLALTDDRVGVPESTQLGAVRDLMANTTLFALQVRMRCCNLTRRPDDEPCRWRPEPKRLAHECRVIHSQGRNDDLRPCCPHETSQGGDWVAVKQPRFGRYQPFDGDGTRHNWRWGGPMPLAHSPQSGPMALAGDTGQAPETLYPGTAGANQAASTSLAIWAGMGLGVKRGFALGYHETPCCG